MDTLSTERPLSRRPAASRGRRRWVGAGVAVVVIVATAAVSWVLLQQKPAVRSVRGGPVTVGTATVDKGDLAVTVNALGTVTPQYSVTIKTQIAGTLTQVIIQEDRLVHAGDVLAQIDPRPYQLTLAQAQGQLAKDQALLQAAQTDLSRYRTLVEQDSIARQQLDSQEALVNQDRATIQVDQAQVDTARLNLTYCHIVSPITGRTGLRLVDPGNYVQPSDATGLMVITQLQPITVIFTLPEDNLAPVIRRLHHGGTLPVVAFNRNQSSELARGRLTSADNQIDTTTGTVKLRAQFDNDDETLFPNQFVNVRLFVDRLHDATLMPAAAIQRGAPGTFVYLVKPDNTVTVRPVTLGPASDDRVAIDSGLQPGDRVVVDGTDKLREGAAVTFASAAATSPAAAPPR